MDSYGNGYSAVGGKRSADDGAVETESESKKQRCEPSKVVHLRNLHPHVTEQEVKAERDCGCPVVRREKVMRGREIGVCYYFVVVIVVVDQYRVRM